LADGDGGDIDEEDIMENKRKRKNDKDKGADVEGDFVKFSS